MNLASTSGFTKLGRRVSGAERLRPLQVYELLVLRLRFLKHILLLEQLFKGEGLAVEDVLDCTWCYGGTAAANGGKGVLLGEMVWKPKVRQKLILQAIRRRGHTATCGRRTRTRRGPGT
jgi:hypothetical protein